MLSKTANRLVLAATSLAFALSPALGQSDSNSIRKALGDYDQSQGAGRSLFTTVGSTFQRLDIDGDGISRKEFDTAEAASMARERAQVAHLILQNDLDGDLVVTLEEFADTHAQRNRIGRPYQPGIQPGRNVAVDKVRQIFEGSDANGNGKLEGPELYKPLNWGNTGSRQSRHDASFELVRALLDADPNKDDLLTEAEALKLVADAFNAP